MTADSSSSLGHLGDPAIAELIVASARDYAIFTMDEDGRVTSWSPGAERVFGYTRSEALGLDAAVLFTGPDRAAGSDVLERETARENGRAEDSRWHLRKSGESFWGNGVTMRLERGPLKGFLKVVRDETAAKLAEQQRVLLLNELNHRIKNTLATVQSIAEQTLRAGNVDASTRQSLTNRLIALSEAHNLLVEENWASADLADVVAQALAPHEGAALPFEVEGPPVRLSAQQALAISLVLHELATNALKYGALSVAAGRVSVTWNLFQDGEGRRYVNLLWAERGGPPVVAPRRGGFGTRLISRSFGRESGGRATLDYRSDGLQCVMQLPLSDVQEIPMDVDQLRRGE
jgi:PAS domain S-box-containing protein